MRNWRSARTSTAAAALVLALGLVPGAAHACVCVASTTTKLVDHATDAFVARIVAGPLPFPVRAAARAGQFEAEVERVAYTVQVTEPLKGAVPYGVQVQVLTAANEAACGYSFKIGETYLILSRRRPEGLHTTICAGNATGESLPAAVINVRRVVEAPPLPPPPTVP